MSQKPVSHWQGPDLHLVVEGRALGSPTTQSVPCLGYMVHKYKGFGGSMVYG